MAADPVVVLVGTLDRAEVVLVDVDVACSAGRR